MRGERGGISAVTVQAAWQYWRNVPGFAAVNEIGRRPPSRFILSHAVWSRSMRGNSCGISNGASLMSASFCCRCCIPTGVSANNRAGHKFNVDQVVDYAPKGASKFSVPRGAYKITKLLPERDGDMRLAQLAEITVRNNGSIS